MMNETIHTILNRRSIRKYTKQSIPEEILNQIFRIECDICGCIVWNL